MFIKYAKKNGTIDRRNSNSKPEKKLLNRRIKDYIFALKSNFFRLTLKLTVLLLISTGLITGSYFTIKGISNVFAASSWIQTDWSGGASAAVATGTVTTYESLSSTDPTTSVGNLTLSATSGWYDTSWKYRRKVTFDNTTATLGTTSEALTNFPVLVKLNATRIDYANTQDAGQDLRFTDSDGTTLLSYEIEKWDETGSSYVWVKVPSIDINSNTDSIYVYYGNTAATDAQAATSVWDTSYKGVWHLNDASGTTATDSVSSPHNGTADGTTITTGLFGNSRSFTYNTADNVHITLGSSLTTYTVEAWAYPTTITQSYHHVAESNFQNIINTSKFCPIWASCSSINTVTVNEWQHFVLAYTNTPTVSWTGYRNGTSVVTGTAAASPNTSWVIGHYNVLNTANNETFNGKIDEVRISNVVRSAAWIAASYKSGTDVFNAFSSQEERYSTSGTLTSNIFDAESGHDWSTLSYTYTGSGTVVVKARSSNAVDMAGATAFSSCTAIASAAAMSTGGCVTNNQRYLQYQITLTSSGANTPTFQDITFNMTPSDTAAPTTNASAMAMTKSSSGTSVSSNGWTNGSSPYFSWTAGADNPGGSGLKGYCLYLGTDSNGDPATSKGLLGTSPVSTTGSTCQFIVSGTSVDLATSGYIGTALSTSTSAYYFNVKAIDLGNNIFAGSSTQFQFRFDNTVPTNVSYTSCASGNFSNVADMSFSWPITGSAASSDSHSGLLDWQYQINSTAGTWNTITGSSYTLVSGTDTVVSGNNIVYFRTIDVAGNISSDATIRTCNLSYGGAAPTFGGSDTVTITPATSTSNSYALSWPAATATSGQTVTHYYYMINTNPPSTLATLQGNASTYIDAATTRTVSAAALANVNKGTNTVYVVAIDDATTPNYSPSNYISGTFTLSSTDPDNVGSVVASDSSIKASSQWNVTLTWVTPTYQGAGNLTYLIKRSTDNVTFAQVGTTAGLSYVDTTPSSALYYYKVYTKDGANAESSGTNAVSITPTGKWTTAPTLDSEPTAGSLTTKKATIAWGTSRSSDSKVQYGTSSGNYSSDEVSNSSQTSSHTVNLTNLKAGTKYYYKAKWTDEDGNTGTSDEKSFSTVSAPTTQDVSAKSIGLTSTTIQYTVSNASSVKIYYGTTTSFGGATTISTSTSETTYTTELTGLLDGTKYYYKINTFDSDSNEYEGTVLDFTTLPRPKITNVRIQQVANTAQSTILVTWSTNTEVSSILTYYPQGQTGAARDEVNVALTTGDHRMIIRSLLPQTDYILIVKGRDKAGNEAVSDSQRLTTATDTRPPQISELHVEGSNIPATSTSQEQTAQLIVSWNTDETGTSQIEFGEGTGTSYSQKTQEDSNLTFNHIVIISGLTPSKVYHLRALSKDKAGNIGNSIDTVTITSKTTENAFNLVITNLQAAFGFLGGLNK